MGFEDAIQNEMKQPEPTETPSEGNENHEEEIGEEFEESGQSDVHKNENVKNEIKETSAQKKQRTKEELIELAEEFYGVKKDEVVIDKNGDLKLVVKINGKKRLVTPQKDILKGFNLNQAGYEKLNEGKQLIKQVQAFFEETKNNPQKLWEIADRLGVDKYQLAQSLLQEKVDEYSLSDEEKRLRDIEKRETELKKKEEEEKQKIESERLNHIKKQEMERYDRELTQAMTEAGFSKASKNTKSHVLMGAISELMIANQLGKEMTCKEAVERAKEKWKEYIIDFSNDIDEHHISKIVPEKIVNAILKGSLNKVDIGIPTSKSQSNYDDEIKLPEYQQKPKVRKKVSMNDFFSNLTG